MRKPSTKRSGYTLAEVMVATGLLGSVGLIIFAIFYSGIVLGAKNTAVNTAHQQARTAMLQMIQDIHSAVSLPYLVDLTGKALVSPAGGGSQLAPGIAFQLYSMGPLQIVTDCKTDSNQFDIKIPASVATVPVVGQHLVIPTHEVEDDIVTVQPKSGRVYTITLQNNVKNAIKGTGSPTNYNIICFITDRCSYIVNNGALQWNGPTTRKAFSVLGSGITNPTPFSTPQTSAGAYDYKFIAAIDLSTADSNYSNRGFKSANILLNGKVPMRARLTTYQ